MPDPRYGRGQQHGRRRAPQQGSEDIFPVLTSAKEEYGAQIPISQCLPTAIWVIDGPEDEVDDRQHEEEAKAAPQEIGKKRSWLDRITKRVIRGGCSDSKSPHDDDRRDESDDKF